MKSFKYPLFYSLMVVTGAGVLVIMHERNAEAQSVQSDTRAAVSSARDAMADVVAASTAAADDFATNVATVTKEGMRKANELATNVAAKAKTMTTNVVSTVAKATTNVVDQAKQQFKGITH